MENTESLCLDSTLLCNSRKRKVEVWDHFRLKRLRNKSTFGPRVHRVVEREQKSSFYFIFDTTMCVLVTL